MRGSPRDARNYELMTVFSPDVPEDEIQGTIDRVVGYITTVTGAMVGINRDSPWGRRRLAYPIRHAGRDVRDGFYTLYHFQVAPHRIEDIERELKLNDRVIRYLLTHYTPRPVEEQAPADGESPPTATEGPEGTATNAVQPADEPTASAEEPGAAPQSTEEPAVGAEEPTAAPEPSEAPTAASEFEPAVGAAEADGTADAEDGEAGTAGSAPPEEA